TLGPGGTSYGGMGAGTSAYISGQGVSSSVAIAGGEAIPDIVTLYDWLLAGYSVQTWIAWGGASSGGGAHSLTVYGIDLVEDASGHLTGAGILSFIDPYGGTPVADGNTSSAVVIPS